MNIRLNEDYFFWCCDWCDSENRVLWLKLEAGATCGACHRPLLLQQVNTKDANFKIVEGSYRLC